MIFQNLILNLQKTHRFSITNTNHLIFFKKIIGVYSESQAKPKNSLWVKYIFLKSGVHIINLSVLKG
jgi:hypothetical protein